MSVRQKISNHPGIVLVIASVAIAATVIWIVHTLHRATASGSAPAAGQAFFTTDEGATLFKDDIGRLPPFDHDGREAVRAVVFTCDGGQHHWVQYLEKYTDDAKQRLEAAPHQDKGDRLELRAGGAHSGLLVKSPGAGDWVTETDFARFQEISQPKPPAGMGDGPPELFQPSKD